MTEPRTLVRFIKVERRKLTRREKWERWSANIHWPIIWLMTFYGGALGFLSGLH